MANELSKTQTTVRTYNFQKRGVALSFGLETNDTLGKQDFIELLKAAQEELQSELDQTK